MIVDRLIGLAWPSAALRRAAQLTEQEKPAAAFWLLTRAAMAGLPEAEYRIARAYLEGAGVPASETEAARWLERAASHGWVEAQSMLAALCLRGLTGAINGNAIDDARADRLFAGSGPSDPDFESALKWARQAAEAGSHEGQALLGYILAYGPRRMRDAGAAHQWYARSAAAGCPQGHLGYALSLAPHAKDEEARLQVADEVRSAAAAGLPTAIYLLGVLTESGAGVPQDAAAAVEHYCSAAEKGHRAAQVKWGLALIEGRHVNQDLASGELWLRRAALAGDAQAATLVADKYIKGPMPPNYVEAANWYKRAAEAGDKAGARALASLYLTGAGVMRDDMEAARWLRVSGEAGDQVAQSDLANLVLQGVGAPDDPARVTKWFAQSALAGDLVAAFNLGVCLVKGVGVEPNEQCAAEWVRRAAEGVPDAQFMYGRMLAEGRGVPPDLEMARAWFARAAEAGIPDAQVALAEMMVNGRGGPMLPGTALTLFEGAATKGHAGAMFALGAIYGGGYHLPPDQVSAQKWFRAAAELGHSQAQLMLGRYLAIGVTMEPDQVEACIWLERAVAQGVTEAEADLAEITSALGSS
jgi:TPR repeat protein